MDEREDIRRREGKGERVVDLNASLTNKVPDFSSFQIVTMTRRPKELSKR